MLAYLATKDQFLKDAPTIADEVKVAVQNHLRINLRPGSPEYQSWQNSLGGAMFHVLNSPFGPVTLRTSTSFKPSCPSFLFSHEYRLGREPFTQALSGGSPSVNVFGRGFDRRKRI